MRTLHATLGACCLLGCGTPQPGAGLDPGSDTSSTSGGPYGSQSGGAAGSVDGSSGEDTAGADASTDGGPVDVPPQLGDPIVLFSDLTFAPNSGWSAQDPALGAVVTVWGHNFGAERGRNFVTVNGTDLVESSSYVDMWAKTSNPVPFLESITFQLDARVATGPGAISVTVGAATSNEISFDVGAGSIYFVDVGAASGGSGALEDPWQDLSDYIDVMQPGDIAYFRSGLYDQIYNGGKSNIWVRDSEASGTATQPIAFVGYPGEWPMFDSDTNGTVGNFNKSIIFDSAYTTIAKVATNGFGTGIDLGAYGRAVGNDVIGCRQFVSGTGIITSGGDGAQILGNTTHGARSQNRLDHAIYLSGCSPVVGAEIGYNFSYDNEFDRGPHYIVNHQEDRCGSGEYLKSHSIHHNMIDCEDSPSRAIGVFDQSWDEGEPVEPEPTYIYNNIMNACGQGGFPAMYHNNGHAVFYSNTTYASVGPGLDVSGDSVLSTQVTNNIFHQADDSDPYVVGEPTAVDNNLYYGAQSYEGADSSAVQADPTISIGPFGAPYLLEAGSAAVDQGVAADAIATDDFNGTPRPQGAAHDIGAVERESRSR